MIQFKPLPENPPPLIANDGNFEQQTGTDDRRNDRKRSRGQYDPDSQVCWDWLNPKGCNRENCKWKHDQRKQNIVFYLSIKTIFQGLVLS